MSVKKIATLICILLFLICFAILVILSIRDMCLEAKDGSGVDDKWFAVYTITGIVSLFVGFCIGG